MENSTVNHNVGASDRRPLYLTAVVLAGVPLCVPGLLVGASLTKDLSLVDGLSAAVIGCLILTIYAGLIAWLGMRTGSSSARLMSSCFGTAGVKLTSTAIAVCLAGWYAVQTGYFGKTLHAMVPNSIFTSPAVASAWGGLLMLSSAYFGFRGLSWLSVVAVPAIFLLSALGLYSAVGSQEIFATKEAAPGAFWSAVTMVVGSFAIGATVIADITRFCRTGLDSWITTVTGFFFVTLYVFLCGAATAITTGNGDLIAAMVSLGMGVPALAVLVLSQWTTNDNNLYSASTSIKAAFPEARHHWTVLIFGLAATTCAVLGIAEHFIGFLIWLGVVIPPLGGIVLAHHLVDIRMGTSTVPLTPLPLPPIIAVGVGVVSGLLLPAGIPSLNALISAAMGYLLARQLVPGQYSVGTTNGMTARARG